MRYNTYLLCYNKYLLCSNKYLLCSVLRSTFCVPRITFSACIFCAHLSMQEPRLHYPRRHARRLAEGVYVSKGQRSSLLRCQRCQKLLIAPQRSRQLLLRRPLLLRLLLLVNTVSRHRRKNSRVLLEPQSPDARTAPAPDPPSTSPYPAPASATVRRGARRGSQRGLVGRRPIW